MNVMWSYISDYRIGWSCCNFTSVIVANGENAAKVLQWLQHRMKVLWNDIFVYGRTWICLEIHLIHLCKTWTCRKIYVSGYCYTCQYNLKTKHTPLIKTVNPENTVPCMSVITVKSERAFKYTWLVILQHKLPYKISQRWMEKLKVFRILAKMTA